MGDTKASKLITLNNETYAKISNHNNVSNSQLNTLLTSFGLDENNLSLANLNTKQKGQLLKNLGLLISVIGTEMSERTFEDDISNMGYTSIQEVVDDLPILFGNNTQTTAIILRTLGVGAGLGQFVDNTFSDEEMITIINKLISLKQKIQEGSILIDTV